MTRNWPPLADPAESLQCEYGCGQLRRRDQLHRFTTNGISCRVEESPIGRRERFNQNTFEHAFQIPEHSLLRLMVERHRFTRIGSPRQPIEQHQSLVSGEFESDRLALAAHFFDCPVIASNRNVVTSPLAVMPCQPRGSGRRRGRRLRRVEPRRLAGRVHCRKDPSSSRGQ